MKLSQHNFRINSSNWESYKNGIKHNSSYDVFELENWEQLFTWNAAMRETEEAWVRMPTDAEWGELVKTKNDIPNIEYNGYYYGGSFNSRGYDVYYWSSTVYALNTSVAWCRGMYYANHFVGRYAYDQSYASSVRCIEEYNQ